MWKMIFKRNRQAGTRSRERGLQFAEMALVLPIMMLLIAGIVELSWYFYTYATLARATRAGAGYIYTKAFNSTEIGKAKNLVLCGDLNSCSGKAPLVSGLTLSKIDVALGGTAPNQTVTVRVINFSYTPASFFDLEKFGSSNWDSSVTKVNAATTMRYVGDR